MKQHQGSCRTLVPSTSQSLNTTFQTEVPEILPYCGPINSAGVQTQLYSKRFTPKIHSSPHNRQNQILIAMHQLAHSSIKPCRTAIESALTFLPTVWWKNTLHPRNSQNPCSMKQQPPTTVKRLLSATPLTT